MAVVKNDTKVSGYDLVEEFTVQAGDSPAALQIEKADRVDGRDLIFMLQIRTSAGVLKTGDATGVWDSATGVLTVTEPTATFANGDIITVWARFDNRN